MSSSPYYGFAAPAALERLVQALATRRGVRPLVVVFDAFARGLALDARELGLELPAELRSEDQETLDALWVALVQAVRDHDVGGAYKYADRLMTRFLRSDAVPSWAASRGKGSEHGAFAVLLVLYELCSRAAEPAELTSGSSGGHADAAVTIYRVMMRGAPFRRASPEAELVLYRPLEGDPHSPAGARLDVRADGPHLCRAIGPDGEPWHGELIADVRDDGQIEATIAWSGWDDYETDVGDLFAAPLTHGRSFRARHLVEFEDAWDLRVVRVE